MISQERKDDLYDLIFAWILEYAKKDADLYRALHVDIGMTKNEVRDHGVHNIGKFCYDDSIQPDPSKNAQERKAQLYDRMFGWVCEHIHDSRDLYITLHEHFGMSKAELHDHCIESLDEYFPEEDARTRLSQKVKDCFEQYKTGWLKLQPCELVERAEEIASVQRMAEELPSSATEADAEYLLRFKNPLEVVSDAWQEMNGSGTVVDDDMSHILWDIRDKGAAEQTYAMEPEFCEPPPQMIQPSM